MYIEDDTRVPWPALFSWAIDTAQLEPLGYMRNVFRTEFHPQNGRLVVLDIITQCNLTTWPARLIVAMPASVSVCKTTRKVGKATNCAHTHFYQPERAYIGMWLASHDTLLRYINSSLFSNEGSQTTRFGQFNQYGYPERSTGTIQAVYPLKNDLFPVVLPYFPDGPRGPHLAPVAAVGHSRNGYASVSENPLAKIYIEDALVY